MATNKKKSVIEIKKVTKTTKPNNAKKKVVKKVVKPKKIVKKPVSNKNIVKSSTQKKKLTKTPEKKNWKYMLAVGVLVAGIIGVTLAIVFALIIIFTAPDFNSDLLYDQEMTVLLDKNGDEFARLGAENREIVYYDELPQTLVDAIIATEDSRFFQHNGLDIARFTVASIGQILGNSAAGGASTLTMQVAKQRLTSYDATGLDGLLRKFHDIYLSVFKIEQTFTKQEIIEFYVNIPWLGNSTWGVEAASQKYFGKSVRDLTLTESALMAGIFNLPASYNPFSNIELATQRRSVVLNLMVRHGYITEEQKEYAESIPVESLLVPVDERNTGLNEYQSFIDVVVDEVVDKTDTNPYIVPMVIETTLDPEKQDILIALDNEELASSSTAKPYTFVNDVVQTAIAITNVEDGSISAILGRLDQENEDAFNLATEMYRHPGSTAKPFFDYAPYIEFNSGSTGTYFFDEQYSYSNGSGVKNSDGTYMGMVTMRTALARSRNIPALQAFQEVDKNKISDFVRSVGIDYGDDLHEATSLGGFDGVSPLQLSAAYAAFGSGGYYTEPYSFTKITYIDTDDVFEYKPKSEKVMSSETAYMMNSMLMTATAGYVAGNVYVSGTDIASKSGTSTYDWQAMIDAGVSSSVAANMSRDNWVTAYSPDYAITLWYGYEYLDKDYYTTALGGNTERSKIIALVANKVFETNSRFTVPNGIVRVEVEKETFPLQLPSENTPDDMRMTEIFKKGTEPDQISTRYATLENPTNLIATNVNGSILLGWDSIMTPEAIDPMGLQNHYEEYYQWNDISWSEKYYTNRITYNEKNIGTVMYDIYLDEDGVLNKLGETSSNTFNVTCPNLECTYTVKSSYSIFTSSDSSGISVTTNSFNTGSSIIQDPLF